MNEIEELRKEAESWIDYLKDQEDSWLDERDWKRVSGELAGFFGKMLPMLKDAERYRWLRHGDNDELVMQKYSQIIEGEATHYLRRNESLDDAIDAAMSHNTPKG